MLIRQRAAEPMLMGHAAHDAAHVLYVACRPSTWAAKCMVVVGTKLRNTMRCAELMSDVGNGHAHHLHKATKCIGSVHFIDMIWMNHSCWMMWLVKPLNTELKIITNGL